MNPGTIKRSASVTILCRISLLEHLSQRLYAKEASTVSAIKAVHPRQPQCAWILLGSVGPDGVLASEEDVILQGEDGSHRQTHTHFYRTKAKPPPLHVVINTTGSRGGSPARDSSGGEERVRKG